MKILHVVTDLDPRLGGSVEAARQMAMSMQACGVDIEVLTLVSPREEWMKDWPVKIHAVGSTRSRYCYSKELAPWLRRTHSCYSALIVHGVWRYPSWGVQRILRHSTTPYFLFTHGMLDPWFKQAYFGKHLKKALWWRLREHRTLRDARAVLFTSQAERTLSRISFRPYVCREVVTGLGTVAPPLRPLEQLAAFEEMFPHLRKTRNILSLSRIHKKKGCDLLIQAFGNVAAQDPALHLIMAGEDEERWKSELQKLASTAGVSDRITWTGHLDGDLKWGAFRAAEVFALPSHSENYGVAMVEAMACGVPVLISDKVNIWQEVAADGAGLVAADDLEGTTGLLQRWLALTAGQKARMRIDAVNSYQQRFELQRFAERFVEFLKQELESRLPVEA
jgi:glycosyltransferase involved in cell wall biosynthesis